MKKFRTILCLILIFYQVLINYQPYIVSANTETQVKQSNYYWEGIGEGLNLNAKESKTYDLNLKSGMIYIEVWSTEQSFSIALFDSKGKTVTKGKSITGGNMIIKSVNGLVYPDIPSYYVCQYITAGDYKLKITNTSNKSDSLSLTVCSFKGIGKLKMGEMMYAGINKEKTIEFEFELDEFAFIYVPAYNYRNNKGVLEFGLAEVTISEAHGYEYKINRAEDLHANYEGLPCEPGTYKVSINVEGSTATYYCGVDNIVYTHYYFMRGGKSVEQARDMLAKSFVYKKINNTTYNAEFYFRDDDITESVQWLKVKPGENTKYFGVSADKTLGGVTVKIYDTNMKLLQTYTTDRYEDGNLKLTANKNYYISIKKNHDNSTGYATFTLYTKILRSSP